MLLVSCVAAPRRSPAPRSAVVEPGTEKRALLLLMADRRLYEPFAVDRVLEGDAGLRRELAITLGRIGDRSGRPVLEELLAGDPDVEVRRAAAFALGLLGEVAAEPALSDAVAAADLETGRLAAEALGRLGSSVDKVRGALADLPDEERWARLGPALFRFGTDEILPLAREGLASPDPEIRRWAGYAIARNRIAAGVAEMRGLVVDADPWLRGWAARALGSVGDARDLPALRALLDDPAAGPVIHALRAVYRLIETGKAAPVLAWRERLAELLEDPRTGVRMTAVEAAGAWLPDARLGVLLSAKARTGSPRERQLALLALARGGAAEAREVALAAAASPEPALRATAAEAAAEIAAEDLLDRLGRDDAAAVRLAVLPARLTEENPASEMAARTALADPDPAVRAAALQWLADRPVVDRRAILDALAAPGSRRLLEVRVEAARALAARAQAEEGERRAIVDSLEELARDPSRVVRRAAGQALEELGQPSPALGPVDTGLDLDGYRALARLTTADREVELVTRRGSVRLRLHCREAPLTCVNFLRLAGQDFYSGLTFHRVVPDFVVQGGDPRGDGWGGPGYAIRDENSPLRYERGTLGMALSGPDTGGSQFFITLSPQPHLDGSYPAFGRVTGGMEVLDRIEQGDRIEAMREVGG